MTALLTDAEIQNEAMGHCDNASAVRVDDYMAGAFYARELYEARLAEAMRLLREIASYEPLSDSDGGFINTWEEIEAFLAVYAKEDKP